MSSIPDFGGMLQKEFKKKSFGVNEKLGMQKLFGMIVLGPSFSGKSNLAFHILKESPHVNSHLHIIVRNRVDAIKEIPNALQLVIIDDYSNDKKLQRNLFSHFFTRGRHKGLSTIFIAHSYFATDKMIRLNSEYIAILNANSKRDLQLILKDFNLPGVSEDDIYRYFKQATSEKGQMLFIDSVKQQIRKNFKGEVIN
ncbi:TPA: hypothetical protein N0F65_003090 [Lagenidium giganteum]|uniref:Uncharacterized protein n=1 Tax=Lagenidium giganteum TaxID=4803 RepID=A0AAV2YLE8_9STRA|nr:TPA: hypothetical protein N0F65_003090 [Lagenidium giganteum]